MNSLVSAMGTTGKLNDPKLYSSQYGSITAEQYAEMQQTNPWLATVFGASPEALTSQNFGALVEGVPDVNNQTTDFSHQVSQSASEQAIIDLRKQGYQFTDADAQNAIGPDIKPGETAAQYNSRITGQMLPQDPGQGGRRTARPRIVRTSRARRSRMGRWSAYVARAEQEQDSEVPDDSGGLQVEQT